MCFAEADSDDDDVKSDKAGINTPDKKRKAMPKSTGLKMLVKDVRLSTKNQKAMGLCPSLRNQVGDSRE
jgi:hypothetical protein